MMRLKRFAMVCFAAVGAAGVVYANDHAPLPSDSDTAGWNWADTSTNSSSDPRFSQTRAVCRNLRHLEPPATDWPDAATRASLAHCDSENLYYGIGVKANPERARQCALMEAAAAQKKGQEASGMPADPFHGTAMLMTIYANGLGAKRNLDLATSLACRVEGAPFAVDSRVRHLQNLKKKQWTGHDFSICDDVTSGLYGGLCAVHAGTIADDRRASHLSAMARDWSPSVRQRFAALDKAAEAYAESSGENEVDLSGSARVAFEIDREQDVKDGFALLLEKASAGTFPPGDAAAFKQADARLNGLYRRIMAAPSPNDTPHPDVIGNSGLSKMNVRKTQRLWLAYRDAWVRFAAAEYPDLSDARVKAALTKERNDFLAQIAPERRVPPKARPPKKIAIIMNTLSSGAAAVLAHASGIMVGGRPEAAPVLQVIFDPNAPSDAMLWNNLKRLHPDLPVRWLPVAYIHPDSGALAATIMAAKHPALALARNFDGYDKKARHGGVQPTGGHDLPPAQTALRKTWIKWGGYTPMLIFRDRQGDWRQTGGADPQVIAAALARARR
ncbi:DUF1311 domain-containing protein [Porphyrobacter algicida]|uniref:DUF1311 domain-containing protein n=1 Tax=Qipengyuania algicida TaxID=1836209 RepID=A0A845AM89_9SPHN|nr:lysozyme inhibitor LprI family protein [Qipengyuania algicida]MXP29636.1 DUF1311 domain-containing protein [Qipengyuania algicida]